MSKSTSKTAKASTATLAVDYTPEQAAALDEARKAGTSYKAHVRAEDGGNLLDKCVSATRHAIQSGLLVDGRVADAAPGTMGKAKYAELFKPADRKAPVSEVSFWIRLATALEAGVEHGSDLWNGLASGATSSLGGSKRLAKAAEVGKVIDDGGDVEAITKACQQAVAEADRKRAAGRKPRPASETGTDTPPESVIPTTDDPVADALLLAQALDGAVKRIPNDGDGRKAWAQVKRIMAETSRRETTLRKPETVATEHKAA